MSDLIHCPACNMDVAPMEFNIWPGVSVNVCPTCRIGIGDVDAVMENGDKAMKRPKRDKMLRGPKRAKTSI